MSPSCGYTAGARKGSSDCPTGYAALLSAVSWEQGLHKQTGEGFCLPMGHSKSFDAKLLRITCTLGKVPDAPQGSRFKGFNLEFSDPGSALDRIHSCL